MGRGRLAYVIPLTLGVLAGWGESVALHGGVLDFRSPDPWLRACAYAAVFCAAYGLLWALMRGALPRSARLTDFTRQLRGVMRAVGAAVRKLPAIRGPLAFARRHPVACGGLLMWVCWLPYACLLYPGILWADTSTQLEIVYAPWKAGVDSGAVNDHHPFMDTLLFGVFSDLGERLGSAQAGLFALVLLLGLLQCLALTRLAVVARRWGASRGGVLAAWWFLCLFPFCPVIFASLVKDTVFTVAFTWFLCVFLELLAPHGGEAAQAGNDATSPPPSGWRLGVELVAAVVAMCLSKKLGVYVAAGSLLAAVCVLPAARRRGLAAGAAAAGVLVAQVVMPVLVLPALHVHKGDSTDVFSVQIQQAARLAHDGKLDAEGRDMVRRSLGIDAEEQMFSSQYRGSLYENAMMVEIIKRHQALGREPRLFYWRGGNK